MSVLSKIEKPEDLRALNERELVQLREEIREELIDVVSKNGGHLAPNLGVVELTLAIHRVFNSPQDKIIWDVGHQSYVHKLLTGRREKFKTLRTFGGLSGFPKPSESPHDAFGTGHSSTSISAALGYAKARDLNKENYHVVAVIGDGAMTGGMAFEALNHAGHDGTDLIVILNDNEMSISPNVGAMSQYLNRLRTDPRYDQHKAEVKNMLERIPKIGTRVAKAAGRAKDSIKYLLVPGFLFEELGFTYLGPIDGHDQFLIEKVLQQAKHKKGPVLIHVVTKKGKGYEPAVKNPDLFHGIGVFEPQSGKVIKTTSCPTYTQIFGQTILRLADENPNIVAITAAMATGTGLAPFREKYPNRFYDVGIAEQHAVTFAAGLAFGGLKPVVAIYSSFFQRAYDQVLHDVCLQKANVILAIDRAGVVGDDGPTHHGIFDISFLRIIPNLIFMSPKDENELQHMLYTATLINGPVAVRYPRSVGEGVELDKDFKELPIGKGEVLRQGSDLTLVGIGPVVNTCLAAAEELAKRGIEAKVLNMRFISPIDKDLIVESAQTTKGMIILEDNILAGGFGSAVLEILNREKISLPVKCIGYNGFVEQGPISTLHQLYGLSVEGIMSAAENMGLLDRKEHSSECE